MEDYKKKIKFIVDSSVDLLKEIYEEEEIDVMHFGITINDKQYFDGLNITTDQLYEYVDKSKTLPKTSAFNQEEYKAKFAEFANDYESVIFIGLGSGFSSTFNSARLAALEFDNVYAIDSENLSSGTGLLILKMCKFRKEGMSAEDIVKEIEKLVPNVRSQFAINTLDYLYKGGRCSGVAMLLGSILNLKPIIKVVDNKMVVAKKPIGFKKALDAQLDDVIGHKDAMDLDCIMVTHSKADEDAKYLKEELAKVFDCKILETYASGTISTHCGPRTIGILYIAK